MSNIKDVQGVISKITRPSSKEFPIKNGKNAGKTFTSWSVGIQLEGSEEWYNVKGTTEDGVLKVIGNARLGDEVKIYLESEDPEGKYWKISSVSLLSSSNVPVEDVKDEHKSYTQESMDRKVMELKEQDADKYELGMAKNNAAIIFSQMVGMAHDLENAKQIIKDESEFYDDLVEALFEKGKIIRQKKLGY